MLLSTKAVHLELLNGFLPFFSPKIANEDMFCVYNQKNIEKVLSRGQKIVSIGWNW